MDTARDHDAFAARLFEIRETLRILIDDRELARAATKHERYDGGHLLLDGAVTRYDRQCLSKLRIVPVERPFDRAELIGDIVGALCPTALAAASVGEALIDELARELLQVGGDAMELLHAVDVFVVEEALRRESGIVARAAARIGQSEHYVRNRRSRPAQTMFPSVVVAAASLARMDGRLTDKLRSLERAMAISATRDAKNLCDAARKLGGDRYRRYLYRQLPPEVRARLPRR